MVRGQVELFLDVVLVAIEIHSWTKGRRWSNWELVVEEDPFPVNNSKEEGGNKGGCVLWKKFLLFYFIYMPDKLMINIYTYHVYDNFSFFPLFSNI